MLKESRTGILKHSWIQPYVKQNKKLLILVILLGTLTFISAGALMFTSGYLISKSATRPQNILLVYVPIVLVRAFGIARPIFAYVEQLTSHNFVLKVLSKMRVRLYQKLETQSLMLKSRFKTGDLLGVLADDLEHLQNLYLKTIFPSIVSLVLYVVIIIALGFFSIPFALLMFVLLFVLVVLVPLVSILVNRQRQMAMKSVRTHLYQTLTDAVMGLSDWKISGRQHDFLTSYEEDEQKQDQLEQKVERFNRWRDFLFQMAIALLAVLMIVFAYNNVEAGVFNHIWIAAFVLVVFPLMEAFTPISEAVTQLPNYDQSLNRLERIENASIQHQKVDDEIVNKLRNVSNFTLTINDVDFRYDESQPLVLQQLNLTIKQGEKIAILGKSGAGKSTIAKLLLGSIIPTNGDVTINKISTSKLTDVMSKYISVLQQKPHLFNSSVMNNIRLGNVHATDEEVIEVAKQVQLHDYICSLPDGFNTKMQELGERFSGGERQRIALARILLQNTPVVILDEPTIGLDAITERKLLDTIFRSLEGKTVIWITHHLIGTERMDRVLFIENGGIAMEGTHQQLVHHNPRYQNLYKMDRPITIDE